MATATELTLTMGRTLYSGDPDSDERVQAREACVSVTWSLDEDEQDLPRTTSALAEEAERALAQMIQPGQREFHAANKPGSFPGHKGSGEAASHGFNSSGNCSAAQNGAAHPNGTGTHSHSVHSQCGNGNGHQAEKPAPLSSKTEAKTTEASTTPQTNPMPQIGSKPPLATRPQAITRAQCLAVHSHCTRRGIAQWELLRLVAEHFGKRNLEDLDKAQGGELLTMLQQADHEPGSAEYAN